MKHPSTTELWSDIKSRSNADATPNSQADTSTSSTGSDSPAPGRDQSGIQPAALAAPPGQDSHASAALAKHPEGCGQEGAEASAADGEVKAPVVSEQAKSSNVPAKASGDPAKAGRARGGEASTEPFKEHRPADEPVDPASLLTEISGLIRTFIVLTPEQADAAALWVAHTHMTDVANVSPILIVNAPERACGKTLVQEVLGRLAYRALPASNASLSALFRSIEYWGVTLMIDEADTFFGNSPELHGMVNAGHKRGGTLLRSEVKPDSIAPKTFSVYGAKSIAGIALERILPDSTMSRGIVIGMRRKLPEEKVARLRYADSRVFDRLASQLVRFAMDYREPIDAARPELPEQLDDRTQDNWEPLLAIAMCAGTEWTQRATDAALTLSAEVKSTASTGNDLLADIKEVLGAWTSDKIKTVDLIQQLVDDPDTGWNTYNRGKPLTPRQLAKLLEAYQIKPRTVRQRDGSTPKGYLIADFRDAFTRYLKDVPSDGLVELQPQRPGAGAADRRRPLLIAVVDPADATCRPPP